MTKPDTIRYVGRSMNPYLLQNDLLFWKPVDIAQVAKGDIIIFEALCNGKLIIHRVVKINPDISFITKGDNNKSPDKNPVTVDRLVGIITGGVRASRKLRIPKGNMGMVFHYAAQLRKITLPVIQTIFSSIYYLIADSKIFPKVLSPVIQQKLVVVKTTEGYDMQIYYGNHLAGWRAQQDRGWTIRIPFRIFLDTAILPESTAEIPNLE